jgi:hypothetical protein
LAPWNGKAPVNISNCEEKDMDFKIILGQVSLYKQYGSKTLVFVNP